MKKLSVIISMIMVLGAAGSAFAAYPLSTDDAGTVSPGAYELEAAYDNYKEAGATVQETGASFKHGLTEKMDIGLSFPYKLDPVVTEQAGAAELSLKFSLVEDVLAFSVASEMGSSGYALNTIYSLGSGELGLHLNAGYYSTGDETDKGTGSCGLAAEYPLGAFGLAAELTSEEGGGGEGLLGLRYFVGDGFFLSTAVARSLQADTYRFTAGFHLEF